MTISQLLRRVAIFAIPLAAVWLVSVLLVLFWIEPVIGAPDLFARVFTAFAATGIGSLLGFWALQDAD